MKDRKGPPDASKADEQRARLEDIAARAARVAHDLNNLVSVILGYSNLLVDQVPADSPARRMAEEVQGAALQAAELTRQMVEIRREQRAVEAALSEAVGEAVAGRAGVTVLQVEDDPGVCRLAESILMRGGYQVLLAAEVQAAVQLCERHPGAIALLLAGVTLPGNGSEDLVRRVRDLRPEMRVLFMSGYSSDAASETDASFLPKPFTAEVLLSKVRQVLSRGRIVKR